MIITKNKLKIVAIVFSFMTLILFSPVGRVSADTLDKASPIEITPYNTPDGANNIIAYAGSSATAGRTVANLYTFKNGTGTTNVTTYVKYKRPKAGGPVTVSSIDVKYDNKSNGQPYFSYCFVDRRTGNVTYYTTPVKNMKKNSKGSFTINANASNVQSFQLYVHRDLYASGAEHGTRYQYITAFY